MSPSKPLQKKQEYLYEEGLRENWKENRPVKCTQCRKFHEGHQSGEESQLPEIKTSEESFSVVNSEGNTEEYVQEEEHQSVEYPYHICDRRREMKPYAEVVLAELKELQWRRDLLERHYTDGINKIMNDYFFGDRKFTTGHPMITSGNQERMRAGGLKKNQSPGIRLECGCIHNCEKTRQKILSNSTRFPSTSVNYSSECKTRCPSRSEALRSS